MSSGGERGQPGPPDDDQLAAALAAGAEARAGAAAALLDGARAGLVVTGEPVLAFRVGRVLLGCPMRFVNGVGEWRAPTPIPRAPRHLLGLVSHGDQALPIVDLARVLGLDEDATGDASAASSSPSPPSAASSSSSSSSSSPAEARSSSAAAPETPRRVLFVAHKGMHVGLACSRVLGVVTDLDAERPLPRVLQADGLRRHVSGEFASGVGVIGLVDLPGVLDAARPR